MEVCYAAMGEEGGRYLALEQYSPLQHTRRDIKPAWLMGLTGFGMPVKLKGEYGRPVVPEDRQFAQKWFVTAAELVQDGSIVPAPVLLRPGKFMGVLNGIEAKKKGIVSAGKLVYRVGTA
jgi:aspyridone synthetase trans-acting enoyl reductase